MTMKKLFCLLCTLTLCVGMVTAMVTTAAAADKGYARK